MQPGSHGRQRRTPGGGRGWWAGSALLALLVGGAALVAWLDGPAASAAAEGDTTPPAVSGPEVRTAVASVDGDAGRDLPATLAAAGERLTTEAPRGRFGPAIERRGRTAWLEVEVRQAGLPVRADVRLVAGADAGREGLTDGAGRLTLDELHPGRARVQVSLPGGARCDRDLLLRHRRATLLELDVGDHGVLRGRVQDERGVALAGAVLRLDGVTRSADAEGGFALARLVSGAAELHVSAPGFASHVQPVASADEELVIALRPASTLSLRLSADPAWGSGGWLLLVPEGDPVSFGAGGLRSTYPWESVAGRRLSPGELLVLDDLPTCRVRAVVFAAGAVGRSAAVSVRPGVPVDLALEAEPSPPLVVEVRRGELPVEGAQVALLPENTASDRLRLLDRDRSLADRFPLPLPPQLTASVTSAADGLATLTAPLGDAWVRVQDADGELTVVRAVDAEQGRLLVDLARPDEG